MYLFKCWPSARLLPRSLPLLLAASALLSSSGCAFAETVRFDWEVSKFEAAPDGVTQVVYGINGQSSRLSLIEVTIGDEVEVHVTNKLEDERTCIHWHGLKQLGTQEMDGISGITHCRIPPNSTAVYHYKPDKPGTFWCHAHEGSQYSSGLRTPLIVHQKPELMQPWESDIDGEFTLLLSDWYHNVSLAPPGPPIWDSVLINEKGQFNCTLAELAGLTCSEDQPYERIQFKPGKKYLVRLINGGALAPFDVSIDGHDFQVIAGDADPLVPSTFVNTVRVNVAQRHDIIVQAKDEVRASSFWIRATAKSGYPFTARATSQLPEGFNDKALAVLEYVSDDSGDGDPCSGSIGASETLPTSTEWPSATMIGEFDYDPLVPVSLPEVPDERHVVEFTLGVLPQNPTVFLGYTSVDRGEFRSLNIPDYPTLFSVASGTPTEQLPIGSNAYRMGNNNHVELVLANNSPEDHPFHTHVHSPYVVGHGHTSIETLFAANASQELNLRLNGSMLRDVFTIPACSIDEAGDCLDVGYVVLRYEADNPGVWMVHCHIEDHLQLGLAFLMVENEADLVSLGMDQFESSMINVCNATTGTSRL
jgi:iron transport multicopper oxidase